jgi:hypothetical protein
MAARSISIVLHNTTDQDLTLTSSDLPGGTWTQQPPDNIGPTADGSWESESDGVLTGTQGSVVYSIGGDGDSVLIGWDNPFAGTNKFSINLSSGYALYQTGWDGDNAAIEYTLERSALHATDFRPSQHGFPFDNHWDPGTPLTTIDLGVAQIPIGDASNGLCGGMVYAALDYWGNSLTVPQRRPDPAAPGTPLYDYLVKRLIDSFDLPALPARLLTIMNPAYPDTGSAGTPLEGRAPIIIRESWQQIRSWIDSGFPAPICLQNIESALPTDLGHNHQTAAWGYQMDGNQVTLFTYDPNIPGDDTVSVQFNASDVLSPPSISVSNPHQDQVFCFLTTAYTKSDPPQ